MDEFCLISNPFSRGSFNDTITPRLPRSTLVPGLVAGAVERALWGRRRRKDRRQESYEAQSACRNAAIGRSQALGWFQVVKFRLTTLNAVN